jgi:HD superfamily phosphohydrolase
MTIIWSGSSACMLKPDTCSVLLHVLILLQVVDGHICWHASAVPAVWQAFAARFELHQQVYLHPRTKAAEAMVADALVAANALLKLPDCCTWCV